MRKFESNIPFHIWDEYIPALEQDVLTQMSNVLGIEVNGNPAVVRAALMPDAHSGYGVPIGCVIALKEGIVIPGAVGVDIGCGMVAVTTDYNREDLVKLPLNLLYDELKEVVPMGFSWFGRENTNEQKEEDIPDRYFSEVSAKILKNKSVFGLGEVNNEGLFNFERRIFNQLGTLGGGNHFLEVCSNQNGKVVVLLHSGSRGFGRYVADHYINLAKIYNKYPADPQLSYLTGDFMCVDYLDAMRTAQTYAELNRELMMSRALKAFEFFMGEDLVEKGRVSCHHNYGNVENVFGVERLVIRKGAVDASEGVLGIIPSSMGGSSYIVEGLGNPDSLNSCSHGAGRVMSRGFARKNISLENHIAKTEGVVCDKTETILDESPEAYKDIDLVMKSQSDLVKIVDTLTPIVNCKG